jgi:hypothetical protein
MSEVIFVMLNKISFKLSTETFGCDNEPTDVVEIYIDGDNLRKNFMRITFVAVGIIYKSYEKFLFGG